MLATILERLRRAGVRLFVVTNKRLDSDRGASSRTIGLAGFFEAIYTPDSRVPRYADKGEMGSACIESTACTPCFDSCRRRLARRP